MALPMEMSLWVFGCAACAAVLTGERGPRAWFYLFKPLALLCLMLALGLSHDREIAVTWPVIFVGAALFFSWCGDIFLMLPKDRFVLGLASFAVAHACYIAAFSAGRSFWAEPWVLAIVAVYGVWMVSRLWPFLGHLRVPVIVYALLIVGMLDQAWVSFVVAPSGQTIALALGATAFVVSDSILAWNRFLRPVAYAQGLILSTYYMAQGLIVGALLLSR